MLDEYMDKLDPEVATWLGLMKKTSCLAAARAGAEEWSEVQSAFSAQPSRGVRTSSRSQALREDQELEEQIPQNAAWNYDARQHAAKLAGVAAAPSGARKCVTCMGHGHRAESCPNSVAAQESYKAKDGRLRFDCGGAGHASRHHMLPGQAAPVAAVPVAPVASTASDVPESARRVCNFWSRGNMQSRCKLYVEA